MHVWLIQQGEPVPVDPGSPRLLRTGLLAEALAHAGHRVTWWTTTFNHALKRQRYARDTRIQLGKDYELILLRTPGYRQNISIQRMIDHRLLGRRFAALSEREPAPDVIHCGFPTIELAYAAAQYSERTGVPLVVDARDMWPDIFLEGIPRWLRLTARLLLHSDFRMTKHAFSRAAAITAHAPGFVDWGLKLAGRKRTEHDKDFPFSYPHQTPGEEEMRDAVEYWRRAGIGLDADEFVVCLFGTFAARKEVDLRIVPQTARLLERSRPRIRFVLCGTGPAAERLAQESAGLSNVLLPGWVDYPRIRALMRSASVGLLPYLPSRDFAMSIPNKAVEYLSAGLPVVTSLIGGYLDEIIGEFACGVCYRGGDPSSLATALRDLSSDRGRLTQMGMAAKALFEQRLRSDIVNDNMIEHLARVAAR